jgi:hypothetical protein
MGKSFGGPGNDGDRDRRLASEVRGGATEPAELAFAPGADHDQTGLIVSFVLEESDARIAAGNHDGVFHAEIAE